MSHNSNSDDSEYEISNIKRNEAGSFFRGHYTDKQLQEAVEAEREDCVIMLELYAKNSLPTQMRSTNNVILECAEVIRKRGNYDFSRSTKDL